MFRYLSCLFGFASLLAVLFLLSGYSFFLISLCLLHFLAITNISSYTSLHLLFFIHGHYKRILPRSKTSSRCKLHVPVLSFSRKKPKQTSIWPRTLSLQYIYFTNPTRPVLSHSTQLIATGRKQFLFFFLFHLCLW